MINWGEIFAFFISDNVISDAKEIFRHLDISPIFKKHGLKDGTHPSIVSQFYRIKVFYKMIVFHKMKV